MSRFIADVIRFNQAYGLPAPEGPVMPTMDRLVRFREILMKELTEVDDIITKVGNNTPSAEVLADFADWLTDIQVYCASEMVRHGLWIQPCYDIVMQSNMTKLGADGKPVVVNGLVVKGPNFVPPEPCLRHIFQYKMDHPEAGMPEIAEAWGKTNGGN